VRVPELPPIHLLLDSSSLYQDSWVSVYFGTIIDAPRVAFLFWLTTLLALSRCSAISGGVLRRKRQTLFSLAGKTLTLIIVSCSKLAIDD
ncbi:MAG: hypothetical protein MZV65_22190, partial [Chromatiales bacterium]|nr:hypothetical protein [Chromatiales bacterium]